MLFEGCCDIEIFLCYRHTLTSDINCFRIFAKLTLFITPVFRQKVRVWKWSDYTKDMDKRLFPAQDDGHGKLNST